MSDNIILLGSGVTAADCPFDKEVWGCNNTIRTEKKVDKHFFFDDLATFDPKVMHIQDLIGNSHETEHITTFKNAQLCSRIGVLATVYPIDEVIRKFGRAYFANTVCYMIAYAMYMGIKKMNLYGIDHLTWQSYIVERCGVEYWLGRAEQSGIEIDIAEGSALLKTLDGKLYG